MGIPTALSIIAAIVGLVLGGQWLRNNVAFFKKKEEIEKKEKKKSEFARIIREFVKAKKEKYCPKIEWVKDEPEPEQKTA